MTSAPNRFITNLKSFNRKERYFLVGWTLGNREFRLGPEFRAGLSSVLNLNIPRDAFVAMDYHLDWIYASAFLAATGDTNTVHPNKDGLVSGSQEDMDLVVAFSAGETAHLIMVEAKGVTGWTNKQATSKARRLEAIFGKRGDTWPHIRPHFVIVSPREPEELDCSSWPGWMKRDDGRPYWIRMELPRGLLRVTRCEKSGKARQEGQYWKVVA
ncbi:hypothetical protein LCGC14_2241030 [marine sediment metagenome]|uniref:Uncharacterized protein n=1 Tax=marine sediment metagenome TaxID=412755 RepID=A0A0F9D5M6_9ZZZZ